MELIGWVIPPAVSSKPGIESSSHVTVIKQWSSDFYLFFNLNPLGTLSTLILPSILWQNLGNLLLFSVASLHCPGQGNLRFCELKSFSCQRPIPTPTSWGRWCYKWRFCYELLVEGRDSWKWPVNQHSPSFIGPLPSLEIIAKNEPFHAGRHAHSCPVTYTVPLFLSSVSPVGLSEKPSSFE